jgi:hypothetical protein
VLRKERAKSFKLGVAGIIFFFSIILFALIYVQLFGFHNFYPFDQHWKAIMFANSLLILILFCFWAVKSIIPSNKMLLTGLSPFLFFLIIHFIIPQLQLFQRYPE